MLLQVAAGSTRYPSLAGPIVLVATALIVIFGPRRWTPYAGLIVPLILGLGAIVAVVMTGEFFAQLTDVGAPGILLGSLMHVVGLIAAVAGVSAWCLVGVSADRTGWAVIAPERIRPCALSA